MADNINPNEFYDIKTIHDIKSINICNDCFILIASKRKSGKSVLTKNLIVKILDDHPIDFIILFSNTAKYEEEEYGFLCKNSIRDCDNLDIDIGKIIKI
jgi:kynurenine formamidase